MLGTVESIKYLLKEVIHLCMYWASDLALAGTVARSCLLALGTIPTTFHALP